MPPSSATIEVLAAAWCALVGGAVGSFLNVVIGRVPAGESIVRPGSRCPRCRTPIRWYDNVPVVSWLVLRARCRACGARISARYPAVEALGAAAGVAAFVRHGLSGSAAAELAFVAVLLALAFIDLDTWLLPNALTWPLLAFGVAMGAAGVSPAGSLRIAAYGAGIGFACFALLWFVGEKVFRKEALGFGDVWLLAALGAWEGPLALLPMVLLASLQGSLVGIALIALGKAQPGPDAASPSPHTRDARAAPGTEAPADEWIPPRHAVPFGPFLVLGALEWLYLGARLARAVPLLAPFL